MIFLKMVGSTSQLILLASIALISKSDKNETKKSTDKSIFLINLDEKNP